MEMATGPCHVNVVRIVSIAAMMFVATPALAQQKVEMIVGSGVTPPLREGFPVMTGTVIEADQQTIVVLRRTWPVQKTQYCEDWVILRGAKYQIAASTGVCKPAGNGTELQRALNGERMVAHMTVMLFNDPKADDPNSTTPPQLVRLRRDLSEARKNRNTGRGRQGAAPQQPTGEVKVPVAPPRRPGGTYVHARHSSLQCLHKQYNNWQNGNPIHLWQCNAGAPDMRMWVYDEQTGYIRSAANPDKCWHKARRDWADGNPIHLWDCADGAAAQKTWTYDHGSGLIRSRVNPAKCIHKKNGGFTNGNPVHLWDCDAGRPEFKSWTMRVQQTRLED
jgi:hypothetical protein